MHTVVTYLRRSLLPNSSEFSDDELLANFLNSRNAITEILQRHGPMVWSTCRSFLLRDADADDAFQSTFLVFAAKAGMINPRRMLPAWLHGVAVKVSIRLRTQLARRAVRERSVDDLSTISAMTESDSNRDERCAELHRAIAELPHDLREVIILCELNGQTRRQVAELLNLPEGTVASRVARGKERLARGLKQPMLASSALGLTLFVAPARALIDQTANAILGIANPPAATAALAQEVISDMCLKKLRLMSVATMIGLSVTIATSVHVMSATTAEPTKTSAVPTADPVARVHRATDEVNFRLLKSEAVRKSLKLSAEAETKIADAVAQAESGWKDISMANVKVGNGRVIINGPGAAPNVIPIPPAPPPGAVPPGAVPPGGAVRGRFVMNGTSGSMQLEKVSEALYGEGSEFMTIVKPILTPEHILRLRQHELVANGPYAFTNRRVVRQLALTEEQEDKIELIVQKHKKNTLELMMSDLKELGEKQDVLMIECEALLTADQTKIWKAIAGDRVPGPELTTSRKIPTMKEILNLGK